jgi:hypothetical protein
MKDLKMKLIALTAIIILSKTTASNGSKKHIVNKLQLIKES